MNRKMLIVVLPVFLLACNFLSPTQGPPTQPPGNSTVPQDTERFEYDGFIVVRIHPGNGDVEVVLAEEAQKATSQGLMPVVEFDATWCPPCKAIDEGIQSKNKLMMDAYQGTYIIKLDVDEWGWGVGDFEAEAIPIYFKVDSNGKPTGEVIDGNAWGDNIPENIAPPMDAFFHGGL